MKKLKLAMAFFVALALMSTNAYASFLPLTIQEEDGSPLDARVTVFRVTNGTLTDNGNGDVSLSVQASDATLDALAAFDSDGILTQTATNTFVARTITGTASRIDITNGNGVSGNPTIDIDSGYVGQTSITTLGTIASGTWEATDVGVAHGGTGVSTVATNGQLLIGNGTGYTVATLTDGAGITITEGSGTITIAADGAVTVVEKAFGDTPYTILATDDVVLVDASGGAVVVVLPTAVGVSGKKYNVKKIDSSSNTVTIDGDGTETIDEALTVVISTQFVDYEVVSDNVEWWVL